MELAELLARGPLPSHRALTLIHPLAAATHELHRRGRSAGLADPGRVRLVDGELVADPPPVGAFPDATGLDDVRGLGAILYALLTGYWPLDPATPTGLRPAPRDRDGVVVAPDRLRPGVALEVAELTMAALGADHGDCAARLCTAGAMVTFIEELQSDWSVDLLPPVDGTDHDRTWSFEPPPARAATDPDTRRKLSLGMSGLAAAALITFGLLGAQTASTFGLLPDGPPPIVVGPVEQAELAAVQPPTPVAAGVGGLPGALQAPPAPPPAQAAVQRPTAKDRERLRQQRERERERRSDSDDEDSDDRRSSDSDDE